MKGSMPVPRAIVCISAHWNTIGTMFTENQDPPQIFDFYGFPEELYEVKYAPPGQPKVAKELAKGLSSFNSQTSMQWGIDHAATIPLVHLYPEANVPVIEMSIDMRLPADQHVRVGEILGRFRDEGILFIASGNLIHDFRELQPRWDSRPLSWAEEYSDHLERSLLDGDIDGLVHYEKHPLSSRAFQTPDHYLPLLPILGMKRKEDELNIIHKGIQYGSISHLSFTIGKLQ